MYYNPTVSCYWCQKTGKKYVLAANWDTGKWEIEAVMFSKDHVLPKALGGCSHKENIVHSCVNCNAKKADKIVHPFPSDVYRHVANCSDVRHNRKIRQLPREPYADVNQLLLTLSALGVLDHDLEKEFSKRLWNQPL